MRNCNCTHVQFWAAVVTDIDNSKLFTEAASEQSGVLPQVRVVVMLKGIIRKCDNLDAIAYPVLLGACDPYRSPCTNAEADEHPSADHGPILHVCRYRCSTRFSRNFPLYAHVPLPVARSHIQPQRVLQEQEEVET